MADAGVVQWRGAAELMGLENFIAEEEAGARADLDWRWGMSTALPACFLHRPHLVYAQMTRMGAEAAAQLRQLDGGGVAAVGLAHYSEPLYMMDSLSGHAVYGRAPGFVATVGVYAPANPFACSTSGSDTDTDEDLALLSIVKNGGETMRLFNLAARSLW